MAGLVNWKKAAIPASNPDADHVYFGIDIVDSQPYAKFSNGLVFKFPTSDAVEQLIADLVDSAPATLDTLNELAAALGDDPNFATTITTALALKANTADLGALAFLNVVTGAEIATNAITAIKINNNSVLNSKLSDMPTQTLKGNDTGATADPKDLTPTEVKLMLLLDQVSNTSDANKPVSTAQATAIAAAVTAHEAASDPHPQYLTPAEGNATYQPLDGDLTAVAALAGAGFAVRTTTNAWATRSLTTPVGSGLAITNQDGVFGSPAFTNTDKGSTAVATHEAAVDPHPQYETSAEAQAKAAAAQAAAIAAAIQRSNHIGTQLASTISDFADTVRSTVLTGVSFVDSVVAATDSVLVGLGKLQGQITQAIANSSASLALKANLAGGNAFTGSQTIDGGLQVNSTTEGFLPPRMTSTQRLAIASPAEGLVVFDTDYNTLCFYDGAQWIFDFSLVLQNNASSTSTTYAGVTELTTASLPIGRYAFQFNGVGQSTAITTGIGVRLGAGTATISALIAGWSLAQAADGTASRFEYSQLSGTTNVTSAGVLTANADFPILGHGVFSLSAPGTMQIQLRSEIAASGVSLRINSTLEVWRITG